MRILTVLGVLVALYLIVALFAPSDFRVEREREFTASPEIIFEQVAIFQNWNNWSPWIEKDPTMKQAYEGQDGTVGAKYLWDGDPDISGKGSMTITEIIPNERMAYDLHFEDMNMTSHGAIEIKKVDGSTKVLWYDGGEIAFLFRPMMLFMNMDEMVGSDFEKGLAKLDSIANVKQEEADNRFKITEVDFPETFYYGVKREMKIDEVDSSLFSNSFGQIIGFMMPLGIEMNPERAPSCVTFDWNMESGMCTLMPAISVLDNQKNSIEGITSFTVPSKKAIVVDYYGSYDDLGLGHMAADKYMAAHGLHADYSVEEYITDPTTVESEDQILTKIYYILK